MKFLKFLFYATYIFLVVWFYKTTLNPWISDVGEFLNKKDTTIVLGSFPTVRNDSEMVVQLSIASAIPDESADMAKLNYLKNIFINGSSQYENSQMDADEYDVTARELQMFLFSKFSLKQLKHIGHISLINWSRLEDGATGITAGYNDNKHSCIDLPVLSGDYHKALLHEVWHCIHNANYTYFHLNYEYDWKAAEGYVTEYAATNMDEDIAETGCLYSAGNNISGPKVNIIKEFYKYTY
jgi:hypothetical protein